MYKYLKMPRNLAQYTLMRGVTDFGNLYMYDLFESGYNGLFIISKPRFMEKLAEIDSVAKILLDGFCHGLEYEFRGLDGLGNVQGETSEITNNIKSLNMITKVNSDSAVEISMKFYEKSGAMYTRFIEYYLNGIKDPATQAKTYQGLIEAGLMEAGYENEVFNLLFYSTDNTCRKLERAALLLNWQPNTAETSIFNAEKGDISFKEITVQGYCFPVIGDEINRRAQALLDYNLSDAAGNKKIILQSESFNYTGISDIQIPT